MKKECINCAYFKDKICINDLKNGYFNCKKYKAISMSEIICERKKLLVSKDDEDRLQYLTQRIKDINGGTY